MKRSRRRRIWLVIPVLMALAAVRTAAMGAASADDGKTVVQEQESTAGTAKTMTGDTAAGDKAEADSAAETEAAAGSPEADPAAETEAAAGSPEADPAAETEEASGSPEADPAAETEAAAGSPTADPAAETETAPGTPETEAAAGAEAESGNTEKGLSDEDIERFIETELDEFASEMGLEGAVEYLRKIYDLVSSEDFRSIIQYPEVRELIVEVLKRGAEFASTERELTETILETLEVDESMIVLLRALLDSSDDVQPFIQNLRESETGQMIIQTVREYIDQEALLELLDDLLAAFA